MAQTLLSQKYTKEATVNKQIPGKFNIDEQQLLWQNIGEQKEQG